MNPAEPIKVSEDWYTATTADGVFFGYSANQVAEKVDAAARARKLRDAGRGGALPLTPAQRSSARRELLRELAATRGIRRISVKPAC